MVKELEKEEKKEYTNLQCVKKRKNRKSGGIIMAENRECSSASSCSKESCEGCPSHGGAPKSLIEELNPYSSVKKGNWYSKWKGRSRKVFCNGLPCYCNEKKRI